MTTKATESVQKHCIACEDESTALSREAVKELLHSVPDWKLTANGQRIRREWLMKDFASAMKFFQKVGDIAQREDHHPDLHLVGFRHVTIELFTHAVQGLTENDFILASKIDEVPVQLKE